jgi:hypothetical protein
MAIGFDLKEQMSFQISFAKLWCGNGPFDNFVRPREDDPRDKNEGRPILYLELKVRHYKLHEFLGKRPATARIHPHSIGQELTGTGVPARGQLNIGETNDDGRRHGYVEIFGFLPFETFDAVASALIVGGRDLLARSHLHIGFKDEQDKINFDRREGPLKEAMFLLEDLAITFEIGEKYDEHAGLEQ